MMKGEKVVELQGLRCLAIVSVLLYHIWPDIFKNGFLAVDVFFVVSGYIMAMILLSSNSLKDSFFTTSLNFYYRRIYRILPLYLLNIFATCLFIPAISFTVPYYNFLAQVKSALTFYVNFSMLFESHNYFLNGLSFQWFKHYWSLCVEMQFYAAVPFLLYISKRLPLKWSLFGLWPATIGASVFLVLYKLISEGDASIFFIFTMLPARFYEFGGGFVAFNAQQFFDLHFESCKIKKTFYNFITTNLLSLALLIILLFPKAIDVIYAFPAVVIVASLLIFSMGGKTKDENELKYSFLGNSTVVFIGDASYSLYICHWSIVTLCKAIYDDSERNRLLMLIVCFLVGIFVHVFIEKPIIKARMEPKQFFICLIFAYLAIGIVVSSIDSHKIPSSNIKDIYHNKSMLIANKTEWQNFAKNINPQISAEIGIYANQQGCDHYPQSEFAKLFKSLEIIGTEIKGNGNLSVLVIGNSHAQCVMPAIESAMAGIYSELNLFAIGGSTPFEGFKFSRAGILLKEAVKHYKPDIIYLIFKYQEDFDDTPIEPIKNDPQTTKVQEMINFLSNSTKVLFINEMHFEVLKFFSLKFAETVYHHGLFWDQKFKQKEIEDRHLVSSRRWKEIACKNCIFINMLQAYCKNGWCSPVDATHTVPLLHDESHVTKFGSYLLTPYLKQYFSLMYKILEGSK